jgi:hypothetical protein
MPVKAIHGTTNRREEIRSSPLPVKYDTRRVISRWPFALLLSLIFVAARHGFSNYSNFSFDTCNGGAPEAAVFLGGLFSAMMIVEFIHWAVWRIMNRRNMYHDESPPFFTPGRDSHRAMTLFPESPPIERRPEQPEECNFLLSGGRLV